VQGDYQGPVVLAGRAGGQAGDPQTVDVDGQGFALLGHR
jgi:hypothetical protein